VDNALHGGYPSTVATYTGKGLMNFARGINGFPDFVKGTLYKK
jgi:hypothetical protein